MHVPEAAQRLQQLWETGQEELVSLLHFLGLNLRFLGLVYEQVESAPRLRAALLLEMISRATQVDLVRDDGLSVVHSCTSAICW